MNTNLVYLHIEKSAGSAQRLYFYNSIGRHNVYWHEVPSIRPKKTMYDFFIVGGHRSYSFYEDKELIFTSVVRNPVERVLSFYNYCKEVIPENWVPFGLDVRSLKNTVKLCQKFRDVIRNGQCVCISGEELYDDAINIIFKRSFLIGCMDDIDAFNLRIAQNLGFFYDGLPKDNVGKQGYINEIELDKECLSEIENLVSEDIKLYKFIVEDCNGLYSSVSDARWYLARLELKKAQDREKKLPDLTLISAALREVKELVHGQLITFDVDLFLARELKDLELGIHLFDSGRQPVFSTNSTLLGQSNPSLPSGWYKVSYHLIGDFPAGGYTVGFTFTERLPDGRQKELNGRNIMCGFQVSDTVGKTLASSSALSAKISLCSVRTPTTYLFKGDDSRLITQVGVRTRDKIVSTGKAGFLIHGPYIPLTPGQYQILFRCTVGENGLAGACMDVVANKGNTVIAKCDFEEPDEEGRFTVLPISLNMVCSDLEVRVRVTDKTDLQISMIEITPLSARRGFSLV